LLLIDVNSSAYIYATSFVIILMNNAQELMPHRQELNPDANRIRKDFVYVKI
jgi:hypothetical protein